MCGCRREASGWKIKYLFCVLFAPCLQPLPLQCSVIILQVADLKPHFPGSSRSHQVSVRALCSGQSIKVKGSGGRLGEETHLLPASLLRLHKLFLLPELFLLSHHDLSKFTLILQDATRMHVSQEVLPSYPQPEATTLSLEP